MRIVADTNVIASAFLWGGPPGEVLGAARTGQITVFTSAALIAELEEILARDKFADRLARVGSSVDEIVGDYLALVEVVRPEPLAQPVTRDSDDDAVLAAAVAAGADAIVSGDKDLLTLGAYQGITIISAAQCLQRIREAPSKPG